MKTLKREKTRRGFKLTGVLLVATLIIITTVAIFIANQRPSQANANTSPTLSDPRFASLTQGTTFVSEVPTTLPAGGVTINNQFVLRPLTSQQNAQVSLTSTRAIAIGRTYADAHPFPATALLASFTSIDSVPPPGNQSNAKIIQNVTVWIVTFTSTTPQPVIQGKPSNSQAPTHFNIAINANTGAFVLGFFTT